MSGPYQLIYADPCWSYDNKGTRAKADNHYPTMTLEQLKRLPVWDLAAADCVLAMWWVGPMEREARALAEAWGFKVRNMKLFTWAKLNQMAERDITKALATGKVPDFDAFMQLLNDKTKMGLGNYSRANSEDVLVAVRGAGLERLAGNVKQMVYAPIGRHSAKPDEVRQRLDRLYGPDVSRIELFSRGDAAGWHHWGNENPHNDVELVAGAAQLLTYANDNQPAGAGEECA
ncbi:putative adenine-specific DNA-methyltransferase [Erwinia phage Stean]|nr:putative adenine-specific DNA-methyltransferase [Erwinia phage Stean]